MTKQQIVEELSRLYRLQAEGKKVGKLIAELEEKLCELMDCDDDEEDPD